MMMYFPGANHTGKYFPIYVCEILRLIFKSKTNIFTFMITVSVNQKNFPYQ